MTPAERLQTILSSSRQVARPIVFGMGIIIVVFLPLFSLEGLGRLGYEAAVARDYPIIFGSLFVFGLIGLVVGILSDLMYVFVDPRIDFESREG